jgi:hypothetical protein
MFPYRFIVKAFLLLFMSMYLYFVIILQIIKIKKY